MCSQLGGGSPRGQQKGESLPYGAARQELLSWYAVASRRGLHRMQASVSVKRSDQAEVRTPKARALATACVRVWTPSLP